MKNTSVHLVALASVLLFCCARSGTAPGTSGAAANASIPVDPQAERQLKRAMRNMADSVKALHRDLRDDATPTEQRRGVLKHLQQISDAAVTVSRVDVRHQHPFFRTNLKRFLVEIEYAKDQARKRPPNLMVAAHITGACVYCHDLRECSFDGYNICVDLPVY